MLNNPLNNPLFWWSISFTMFCGVPNLPPVKRYWAAGGGKPGRKNVPTPRSLYLIMPVSYLISVPSFFVGIATFLASLSGEKIF